MDELKARFTREDTEILAREEGYRGFFRLDRLTLRYRLFEGGWSAPLKRELFVRDDAVCVLLYDPDRDSVVLIEQFRVGALEEKSGPWLIELVAGIVEPGESEREVAIREAREEAGVQVDEQDLVPICNYHVSPGGSQEYIHLMCARVDSEGVSGYHGLEHEGEDIRVTVVARDDAWQAVEQGRICNAPTIMALQWLQLKWSELRRRWLNEASVKAQQK